MTTDARLILLFAACFAFFLLMPAFLAYPFPAYPLMDWADVLDLFTPLILIPLYWVLFTDAGRMHRPRNLIVAFLALAALWGLGHGLHLSANSIGNLLGPGATPVHELIHFYDEDLSHYLWHIAVVALSIVLLVPPTTSLPVSTPIPWAVVIPSGLLYGFAFHAVINEGGTVPLGMTAAALITLSLLLKARARIRTNSLTAFLFLGYAFSLLLFVIWFAYWRSFPQFSEAGLI